MSFIGYADPAQLKLLSQALSEYCRANGIEDKHGQLRRGGGACGPPISKRDFQCRGAFEGTGNQAFARSIGTPRLVADCPTCPRSSPQSRSVA